MVQSEDLIGKEWLSLLREIDRPAAKAAIKEATNQPDTSVRCDAIMELATGNELPMTCWLVSHNGIDVDIAALDLLPEASLRQQLLNAQHAMERDYWSKRRLEARYRRLLDMVSEGFVVVDDASGRILEANPVAAALLVAPGSTLVGKPFPIGLDDQARTTMDRLTREARSVTNTVDGTLKSEAGLELNVAVTYLRQSGEGRLLIRLRDDSERDYSGSEFEPFLARLQTGYLHSTNRALFCRPTKPFWRWQG